jgi:hypothetical protein
VDAGKFGETSHEDPAPDALLVVPDAFFYSRRGQFATLTAVNKIPAVSRPVG